MNSTNPRKGAFFGSFDPVTLGHVDLIEQACRLFDELYVFVSVNTEKKYAWDTAQRMAWVKEACAHLKNVKVLPSDGLSVETCRNHGISFMVRGLRNTTDFDYEENLMVMNHLLDPSIETVLFFCSQKYKFISSSNVREMIHYHQSIASMVPECVYRSLQADRTGQPETAPAKTKGASMNTLADWVRAQGFEPKDESLYQTACTHSSYANERKGTENNERLEFMGDAVLQVWSAEALYRNHPEMHEGKMTTLRAKTVCESTLAKMNRKLGWYKFLKLGIGEEKTGGRNRASILADQFEACLGAIFLDLGFDAAKTILDRTMLELIRSPESVKDEAVMDYKTLLQELVQTDNKRSIEYRLLKEEGPSNAPEFTMGVYLDGVCIATGVSSKKKKAEQLAAKQALAKMAR